jgi:hypothetical protein
MSRTTAKARMTTPSMASAKAPAKAGDTPATDHNQPNQEGQRSEAIPLLDVKDVETPGANSIMRMRERTPKTRQLTTITAIQTTAWTAWNHRLVPRWPLGLAACGIALLVSNHVALVNPLGGIAIAGLVVLIAGTAAGLTIILHRERSLA